VVEMTKKKNVIKTRENIKGPYEKKEKEGVERNKEASGSLCKRE
jgi:hypothetical protein